jgi:hypothetical protein
LEHVTYIRNNDPQSAYATHTLNNIHEYGNINNMTLLKQINKGTSMNSLEQFYIQLYAQNKKLVQEQNTSCSITPQLALSQPSTSEHTT